MSNGPAKKRIRPSGQQIASTIPQERNCNLTNGLSSTSPEKPVTHRPSNASSQCQTSKPIPSTSQRESMVGVAPTVSPSKHVSLNVQLRSEYDSSQVMDTPEYRANLLRQFREFATQRISDVNRAVTASFLINSYFNDIGWLIGEI